jgi:phosphoglycerate kinase
MAKKTLADLPDIRGKRALVRVDFNVPLAATGAVTNDRRIRAAIPTIRAILDAGASAIVMSHLGRPKGDAKKDVNLRMDGVADRLRQLLGRPVRKSNEVVGPETETSARQLQPGEVLMLENLRFHPGEQSGDLAFARQLAALGDLYVNDAFGTCHREDASMVAVPRAMRGKPRVAGYLVAKELDILGKLLFSPPHPFLAILGGAKVSDKIGFIESLLKRADRILIGGAMSYTFIRALGQSTGASKVEEDKLDVARDLVKRAGGQIKLPLDHLVVAALDQPQTARHVEGSIPTGMIGVDIGPKTTAHYVDQINQSALTVWNGPLGKYEDKPYSQGTQQVARALANAKGISIVGGGETAEAVEEFGLADRMTHVSTGGGAFLEFIEGTPFPALDELDDR